MFVPESLEAEGWNIEGHSVDPAGDLVWMAIGPSPGDEFEVFVAVWADPDGWWRFTAVADTAESQVELVHAFVTATRG